MDDDDDFGADPEFLSALASSAASANKSSQPKSQPAPQKIQQPTPQRLDKRPPSHTDTNSNTTATSGPKIIQPTPQVLPQRSSGSSILVSPRQKGNPVLASLRSLPWEYSDIPADYGLGLTTCALFLSLKYHRLHPEYIYTRIRNLQGRYNLRILLTMVDIANHEDSLRELSKTSLINNVTIILCWSAAEAARYLELYKSYEHANFGAIKGQQATSYAERLVEFVTVPRGINKADAISLVSAFGSLKNAVNGDPEQVSMIAGWGEKKVKRWCSVVDEPFRVQHAAKRRLVSGESNSETGSASKSNTPARVRMSDKPPTKSNPDHSRSPDTNFDDEEAMLAAAIEESKKTAAQERLAASTTESDTNMGKESQLSGGIAAELAKLRQKR